MNQQILGENVSVNLGRTEIQVTVPEVGEVITYGFPFFGPGKITDVMDRIDGEGLMRPSARHNLFLFDAALRNPSIAPLAQVLGTYSGRKEQPFCLWNSTINISNSSTVYVLEDNLEQFFFGRNTSEVLHRSLLDSSDPDDSKMRAVKGIFPGGELGLEDWLNHPLVVAHFGRDTLPILERVAKAVQVGIPKLAYVSVLSRRQSNTLSFSTLGKGFHYCLSLDCNLGRGDNTGYACGVVNVRPID